MQGAVINASMDNVGERGTCHGDACWRFEEVEEDEEEEDQKQSNHSLIHHTCSLPPCPIARLHAYKISSLESSRSDREHQYQ